MTTDKKRFECIAKILFGLGARLSLRVNVKDLTGGDKPSSLLPYSGGQG
jgi:hypothetical protein